jgi:Uma2 family endonuclease
MQTRFSAVSVEEYLKTAFDDGDREYVDGAIVRRNLGEKDHSRMLGRVVFFFAVREAALRTFCFPSQRVQVTPTRFRVPDICVYIGEEPEEQVFRTPPFLVVEILSKDDRASELQERIDDYLAFGVPYVYTTAGSREARDGILRTAGPEIELELAPLF